MSEGKEFQTHFNSQLFQAMICSSSRRYKKILCNSPVLNIKVQSCIIPMHENKF